MTDSMKMYLENLTTHRRKLHRIPELGRDLPETHQYLLSVLQQLDCRLTFLCDTGICAYFDRGRSDTYAFRADMDALPITENTGCSYASIHDGKMHSCAHDGHMAMALTLAQYLNDADKHPDDIDKIEHNVLLIFQPAEETLGGAEEICESGILKEYNVTGVFGIHIWPFLKAGTIASKPGTFMPRSAEINIAIHGRSAHGTSPYKGIDSLYIGSALVREIYMKHSAVPGAIAHFPEGMGDIPKSGDASPEDMTLIQFGQMTSGTVRNIVSDNTSILGTVRAFTEERFAVLINLIKDCTQRFENEYGCTIEFTKSDGYPPVVNSPQLYSEIIPLPAELTYEEISAPLNISDDFAFFGHYVPALYFALGCGTGIPLHSDSFDFDENILLEGLHLYKSLLQSK